ncbi:MAG: HAMP domain-containing sensor histidine kinase [Faecalibacterium sp.]
MKMKNSITRRWVFGNLAFTVVLLLTFEAFFVFATALAYYGGAEQSITNQYSAMFAQVEMYTGQTDEETANLRGLALQRMVEQFSAKDQYEFMLLGYDGEVLSTSSGTAAQSITTDEDFTIAQTEGEGEATYYTEAGERVMSVCVFVPFAANDIAAVRFVTSLSLVDETLYDIWGFSAGIALIILAISVGSGLYFVRGIVQPLKQIEAVATEIARGDLQSRLPQTEDTRNEINRLCISINHMASGLAETEQMKTEFISSVSHELRTPLTSIKGWLETIQTIADPADENYRKGLVIIDSETDRLYAMVEELLDFSRLQAGNFKIQRERLDLVAELTDAVLFAEARIHNEGLQLHYQEPEQAIVVMADPARLRQVFINLIDNAIKYSVYGGKLTVNIWQGNKKAFIEIIDQGKGISPDELNLVKAKFFKGKNAVRGSGIGLALVEEIMTALEGSIDIKSTLGKGTVVTLGLPLYQSN